MKQNQITVLSFKPKSWLVYFGFCFFFPLKHGISFSLTICCFCSSSSDFWAQYTYLHLPKCPKNLQFENSMSIWCFGAEFYMFSMWQYADEYVCDPMIFIFLLKKGRKKTTRPTCRRITRNRWIDWNWCFYLKPNACKGITSNVGWRRKSILHLPLQNYKISIKQY